MLAAIHHHTHRAADAAGLMGGLLVWGQGVAQGSSWLQIAGAFGVLVGAAGVISREVHRWTRGGGRG